MSLKIDYDFFLQSIVISWGIYYYEKDQGGSVEKIQSSVVFFFHKGNFLSKSTPLVVSN